VRWIFDRAKELVRKNVTYPDPFLLIEDDLLYVIAATGYRSDHVYDGNLDLSNNTEIRFLPDNFRVTGNLYLYGCTGLSGAEIASAKGNYKVVM
jgi:hypothetical protein